MCKHKNNSTQMNSSPMQGAVRNPKSTNDSLEKSRNERAEVRTTLRKEKLTGVLNERRGCSRPYGVVEPYDYGQPGPAIGIHYTFPEQWKLEILASHVNTRYCLLASTAVTRDEYPAIVNNITLTLTELRYMCSIVGNEFVRCLVTKKKEISQIVACLHLPHNNYGLLVAILQLLLELTSYEFVGSGAVLAHVKAVSSLIECVRTNDRFIVETALNTLTNVLQDVPAARADAIKHRVFLAIDNSMPIFSNDSDMLHAYMRMLGVLMLSTPAPSVDNVVLCGRLFQTAVFSRNATMAYYGVDGLANIMTIEGDEYAAIICKLLDGETSERLINVVKRNVTFDTHDGAGDVLAALLWRTLHMFVSLMYALPNSGVMLVNAGLVPVLMDVLDSTETSVIVTTLDLLTSIAACPGVDPHVFYAVGMIERINSPELGRLYSVRCSRGDLLCALVKTSSRALISRLVLAGALSHLTDLLGMHNPTVTPRILPTIERIMYMLMPEVSGDDRHLLTNLIEQANLSDVLSSVALHGTADDAVISNRILTKWFDVDTSEEHVQPVGENGCYQMHPPDPFFLNIASFITAQQDSRHVDGSRNNNTPQ